MNLLEIDEASDIEVSIDRYHLIGKFQVYDLILSPIKMDKFVEEMKRLKNENDKKLTELYISTSDGKQLKQINGLRLKNSTFIGKFIIRMLNELLDLLLTALDNDSLDNALTDPNTGENFSYESLLTLYDFYLKRYINHMVEEYNIINEEVTRSSRISQVDAISKLLIYNPQLVDHFPKNERIIEELTRKIVKISISQPNIFRYDAVEFIRKFLPPEDITEFVINTIISMSIPEESIDTVDDYINLALEFLDYGAGLSSELYYIYRLIINNALIYRHPDLFDYKTMKLNKTYESVRGIIWNAMNENGLKALKFFYDLNPADSRKIAKDHVNKILKHGLVNPQNKYEIAAYNMSQDVLSRSYSYL